VSAGNIRLCVGQHFTRELRVERARVRRFSISVCSKVSELLLRSRWQFILCNHNV
jgi:hypothetical protein